MSLKTYKEKLFVLVAEMILNEDCEFIVNKVVKAELEGIEVGKNKMKIYLNLKEINNGG